MVCLSFDIEEFDLPTEHGVDIPFERQIEVSRHGAGRILDILRKHGVRATFFTTVSFAKAAPEIVGRIVAEGHELASHGMQHSSFRTSDLLDSRRELERLSGAEVKGYRQARMMKLDEREVAKAGYFYDSSLNPTFIPGRYMSLSAPRTPYIKDGVVQIPASVTPLVRFPMFWLAAHLLPPSLYRTLAWRTLVHDGHFVTYFHPWEFYDLHSMPGYKIPGIVSLNTGDGMAKRLDALVDCMKSRGVAFATISELAEKVSKESGAQ